MTLIACIAGSSIAFLDVFVVNVALPAIRGDLGGGLAAQQWVPNAYLLVLGALLLIGGSLGDVFGERRVFSLGLGGFGLCSILCMAAPSIEFLVAARALQGAAGALLIPSALALIVATFPESERGRAIGTWTAWTGIATVIGPLVGGQLVDALSWRLVFAVNVPLTIATLALVMVAVPPLRSTLPERRVDLVGAALAGLGLAGPVFALIEQPARGWGSPVVLAPLAAGGVLLGAFVLWERAQADPMLPLGLFKRRNFSVGNLQTVGMYAGLAALFFLLTIFLQQVAGYDAFEAGLASFPTTGVLFLLSKRFGALADRYGPRAFMTGGPLLSAVGMLLLLRIDARFDYAADLLPALLVFAVGLAMTVAPLTAAVLAGVEDQHAGVASGVNNAVARVAELLGIAVVGVVVAARFSAVIDGRVDASGLTPAARTVLLEAKSRPLVAPSLANLSAAERTRVAAAATAASVAGFHVGIALGGGMIALAGVVAGLGIRNPRRAVRAEDCAGGSLVGHPEDNAACKPPIFHEPPMRGEGRCSHLDTIRIRPERVEGCEECLKTGDRWMHLRVCLACGHVGCCDGSRHRHARRHAATAGHPIVQSAEPGEYWCWCYVDEITFVTDDPRTVG